MSKSFTGRKRVRKNFGRITEVAPMPNLIEVQKRSYDQFLLSGTPDNERSDVGIAEVFKSRLDFCNFSLVRRQSGVGLGSLRLDFIYPGDVE